MHLSQEQNNVITSVLTKRNVLITGPGGTGKSFLLRYLMDELDVEGIRFGVCGSTGVAAVNVGGTTLHSWAGIGLGEGHASTLANNIRNNKRAFDRVARTAVLILDEVSTISGELLSKVDAVFKIIRGSELPFGGMQMVFVGDFLQLKAVNGGFAFKSKAWKEAEVVVHVLTRVFRQEDVAFSKALSELRMGVLSTESKALFNSRANVKDPNPEILPVAITAKNNLADAINARELNKIQAPVVTFTAVDYGSPSGITNMDKNMLIPKVLSLKEGSRVMCLVNYSPEDQVMNGSTGVVIRFSLSGMPVVRFDNGTEIFMEPVTKEITQNGSLVASRKQIPLRLSWAVSSHKIQGQSLDKAEIHMGDAFCEAQTYVALSRVRTLEGLFIKSINKDNIKADPEALAFYAKFAA